VLVFTTILGGSTTQKTNILVWVGEVEFEHPFCQQKGSQSFRGLGVAVPQLYNEIHILI
jgi:hypothetical protein